MLLLLRIGQFMKLPITQKMMLDWAGTRVFQYGTNIFNDNRVLSVEYEHPIVRGVIDYGPRGLQSSFRLLPDGSVENHCPCRDCQERGITCAHVIALGLELLRRNTDPERGRKAMEEKRRAERLAAYKENDYIQRAQTGTPGGIPAQLKLTLRTGWKQQIPQGRVPLRATLAWDNTERPLDQTPKNILFALNKQDENILFVLEDIQEGPAPGNLSIQLSDFINLLELLKNASLFQEEDPRAITVNAASMRSVMNMDLDRENGELILMVHTELPFMDASSLPVYVVSAKRGWVFDANQFWRIENILPLPLHGIYQQPVIVERASIPHFLKNDLPMIAQHIQLITDITEDLFSIDPALPRYKLVVRGSPASLAATLYAVYEETPGQAEPKQQRIELVAGKPEVAGHFSIPDSDDLMRYFVRNVPHEEHALSLLTPSGFSGERGDQLNAIIGCDEVMNFLGSGMPRLQRLGWKVELEGRVHPFMEELDFAIPVVHVDKPKASSGWFEVGFNFESSQGESLSEADIQRALLKGESFVKRGSKTLLLDRDAIETARNVFSDCASGEGRNPGTFRLNAIYTSYVQSSLNALDGIDVEAAPAWQQAARLQNKKDSISPLQLPPALDSILRPYQKQGVYWLHFLARNGFSGILADEMGLGKTLQALTWIDYYRTNTESPAPVLIVCPTSLVENWAEEAQRFVPSISIELMSGADRHTKWEDLPHTGIVVTSYALIRRDIEKYKEMHFGILILDEAQHIKNRSTQNALAAKQLDASHRLVLTGTPIENSVADLWSIMDFLMPGYLGAYRTFRDNYELPIGRQDADGDVAQKKLRRKLHPFLLRRLKKDVAKDLPPKIHRVISCTLTKDQQLIYTQLLQSSRRKINNMVQQKGFNSARMEILKVLLRLRQTCCHLELLKNDELKKSTHPSAKMALFFELLDEAIDGNHRVLVFSQFTTMLGILRRELEAQGRTYCYLDGSTKNRMQIVREFNTNHSIPVFLISLKAGGTGLNLTGADMVIHFDPWWNPAVEDQATDRAYRIGQKRTVYNIKMITRGTVEEKVLAMQKKKKKVIDATLSNDEQVMQKLTWDDVQDLLTI